MKKEAHLESLLKHLSKKKKKNPKLQKKENFIDIQIGFFKGCL